MRSKLFVPGSRPELFPKAIASEADAISIDLEDSVAEDRKAEARARVAELLARGGHDKTIVVRVNAPGTAHFDADIAAIAGSRAIVNIPKVEGPEELRAAIEALGSGPDLEVLANVETPRGLRRAAEIAGAHPRVVGLQLGLADLLAPHGISRDRETLRPILLAVRLAAAEAGVFAYDSAYPDLKDPDGYRAEAELARSLGFLGKSCIHPSQVAIANEVFLPTEAELAHARRVVEAAEREGTGGAGAFVVDGRMIDAPYVARARRILATQEKP
jgi:citrate lyase subunit beta/citryl-CoA lyase